MIATYSQSLMDALADLSILYPEMRLGQLVVMVSSMTEEERPGRIEAIDDAAAYHAASEHGVERAAQLDFSRLGYKKLAAVRVELLNALAEISLRHGALKFCHLVSKLAATAHETIYNVTDEQLLQTARTKDIFDLDS